MSMIDKTTPSHSARNFTWEGKHPYEMKTEHLVDALKELKNPDYVCEHLENAVKHLAQELARRADITVEWMKDIKAMAEWLSEAQSAV